MSCHLMERTPAWCWQIGWGLEVSGHLAEPPVPSPGFEALTPKVDFLSAAITILSAPPRQTGWNLAMSERPQPGFGD